MNLIQDKVHVLSASLGADDDHPEKVDLVFVRLVAHHHAALLHHALFHHWGHSVELFPELRTIWKVPQTWWNVPEANICIFRFHHQTKSFSFLDLLSKIPGHGEGSVHPLLQLSGSQSLPHEPELEGVRLPAALDGLVPCVVADIIELILLEEVGGLSRVAALEETRFVPDQESRALQTCHQHLVRVPGHRVDSYQTQATQQRIYVDDSVVRSKMLL